MVKSLGLFEMGYEKVELKIDTEEFGGSFRFLERNSKSCSLVKKSCESCNSILGL